LDEPVDDLYYRRDHSYVPFLGRTRIQRPKRNRIELNRFAVVLP